MSCGYFVGIFTEHQAIIMTSMPENESQLCTILNRWCALNWQGGLLLVQSKL